MLLLCLVVSSSGDAQDIVDWQDAAQCVGRVCGIRGTVVAVENDGPSIRLYFDAQRRDVRVILMRGWLVTWPWYDGQSIVATGKVDRFRDHVEVIVLDPRNVVILGAVATPSPAATQPPPPPPTSAPTLAATIAPTAAPTIAPATAPPPAPVGPTLPANETEELRRRVRELEQRVRELEGR